MTPEHIVRVAEEVRRSLAPKVSILSAVPLAHLRTPRTITTILGPFRVRVQGHAGLDDDTYAVTTIDLADESALISLHRDAWRELPLEIPRTRFTLAHELGHIAMHAEELDELDVTAEPDHEERLEVEANLFAAHLLIPDAALKRLANPRPGDLAKRFGVSVMTEAKRIEER